jgi:hypothetical protein
LSTGARFENDKLVERPTNRSLTRPGLRLKNLIRGYWQLLET